MQSGVILRMLYRITNQLAIELKLVFDFSCSIRMIAELEHLMGTVYPTHFFERPKNLLYLSNIQWINYENTVFFIYLIQNLPNKRLVFWVRGTFVSSYIFDATFNLGQSLLMSLAMTDTSREKEHDFVFLLFKLFVFKNLQIKLGDVFAKGFSTATSGCQSID